MEWSKPHQGRCKLNISGIHRHSPMHAACGGVLRDENGKWLIGFLAKLGSVTIMQAKLEGVRHGLEVVVSRQFHTIHVETVSVAVVELLRAADARYHPYGSIIEDCRILITTFHQVRLTHIYREANNVADRLADLGHSLDTDFRYWESLPSSVCYSLHGNIVGVCGD